jgi:hypothetical protein
VVFWGLGPILNQLYLRSDLELLLVAPISHRAIFLTKFLDALQTVLFPSLLGLASLWAFGAAHRSPWLYYPLATLAWLITVSLAVLICMLLVMIIMRFLPTRRAQELWALLWTLCFGVVWAGWMLLSNTGGNKVQMAANLASSAMRRGQFLTWAPAGWAARVCLAFAQGDWAALLANLALLCATSLCAYLLGQWVLEKAFYEGWSRLQAAPLRAVRQAPRRTSLPRLSTWLDVLPAQMRAVVLKDWLTLVRDLQRLAGLSLPLLMAVVYTYLLARQGLGGAALRLAWAILLAPMVTYFVGLRLATISIAMEGQNMALLRAAPMTARRFLWAKVCSVWLPMLLIAEVTGVATVLIIARSAGGLGSVTLLLAWVSLGLAVLGVGCSGLAPQFRGEMARRSAGVIAAYAYMGLGAALWFLSVAGYAWLWIATTATSDEGLRAAFAALPGAVGSAHSPEVSQLLGWVRSPWVLAVILVANLGLWAVVALIWRLARRRVEAWQITDLAG